ncbi:MAG: tRNA (cytidine(34)-2'-O)-methyltransferase [Burkholderiales bacterium]
MFHIVLVEPEIPPNTGNIVRLAANTGCSLHLVRPLGFSLAERNLKRAGMDYREFAAVAVHDDWAACLRTLAGHRLFALSTKGAVRYDRVEYAARDAFVFGSETRGLGTLLETFPESHRLTLSMAPGNRSLNLSNAVAVVVYEAWRQQHFAGSG